MEERISRHTKKTWVLAALFYLFRVTHTTVGMFVPCIWLTV